MLLSILKETGCLSLLTGKSLDSTVSPNLCNKRHGIQYSKKLSIVLFSHGMAQCFLGVPLQSSENLRKHCFCDPRKWGLIAKDIFPHSEDWIVVVLTFP